MRPADCTVPLRRFGHVAAGKVTVRIEELPAAKTGPIAERLAAALSARGTSVLRTDEPAPVLCVLGRNPDAAPIV